MNKNLIDDEELKNLSANYSELDIIYRIELLKRPTKYVLELNFILVLG